MEIGHKDVLCSGGTAPRILNLGAKLRWVVSFTPQPLYSRYPLVGPKPVWMQWRRGKLSPAGNWTPTVQPIAKPYTNWANPAPSRKALRMQNSSSNGWIHDSLIRCDKLYTTWTYSDVLSTFLWTYDPINSTLITFIDWHPAENDRVIGDHARELASSLKAFKIEQAMFGRTHKVCLYIAHIHKVKQR
jgi:hypothetical protein